MIKAIVLLNILGGYHSKIHAELKKMLPFVEEIAVTFGKPDMYVHVHADNSKDLYELLTLKIAKIEGVVSTDTKIIVPEEIIESYVPTTRPA